MSSMKGVEIKASFLHLRQVFRGDFGRIAEDNSNVRERGVEIFRADSAPELMWRRFMNRPYPRTPSDLVGFKRFRRKQLLRLEPALGQALFVVVA